MKITGASTPLESWGEYCEANRRLALLVLESQRQWTKEIQSRIDNQRSELEKMLDRLMGV